VRDIISIYQRLKSGAEFDQFGVGMHSCHRRRYRGRGGDCGGNGAAGYSGQ